MKKLLILLAAIAALTLKAADTPRYGTLLQNTVYSSLTTNSVSDSGSTNFIVPVNGLGLSITFHTTNSLAVSNAVFMFAVSIGGTNFATTGPGLISVTIPMNGTNNVCVYTNVPASVIGNSRFVKVVSVANTYTNNLFLDHIGFSYDFNKTY